MSIPTIAVLVTLVAGLLLCWMFSIEKEHRMANPSPARLHPLVLEMRKQRRKEVGLIFFEAAIGFILALGIMWLMFPSHMPGPWGY